MGAAPVSALDGASDHLKAAVLRFIQVAFNERNPSAAADELLSPDYRQHNPLCADGADGFVAFAGSFLCAYPESRIEVLRSVAEDDIVMIYTRIRRGAHHPDLAGADVFRFQGGKIAEHWDVIQEVPDSAAHENGMF